MLTTQIGLVADSNVEGVNTGQTEDRRLDYDQVVEDMLIVHGAVEQRYAYPDFTGFDYPAYLEELINTRGNGISSSNLALELQKILALFGDPNATVRNFEQFLKPGYLPFIVVPHHNTIVCLQPDGSALLHPEYPFLESINGITSDELLQMAGLYVPKASQQFQWTEAVSRIRYIRQLLNELDVREGSNLKIELNDGRQQTTTLEMPISEKLLSWQRADPSEQLAAQGIGYLRLADLSVGKVSAERVQQKMHSVAEMSGLVIDVRGLRTGSRELIHHLAAYFMPETLGPVIFDAASLRVDTPNDSVMADYLIPLKMYPVSAGLFSEIDLAKIKNFKRNFYPEIKLPPEKYGEWHYSFLRPNPALEVFNKPVVVLMDAHTGNEAEVFAAAFKELPYVTVLGNTSSGSSEAIQYFDLPNSGLQIQLPALATFQSSGLLYTMHGVTPDIYQDENFNDFTGATDLQLEAALKHIKSSAK